MPNPIDPAKFEPSRDGLMAACSEVFPIVPGRPMVRTRHGMVELRATEADSLFLWLIDQLFGPSDEWTADQFSDLLDDLGPEKLETTLSQWRKEAAWSCDCGEVVPPDVADCPSCQPSLWCRCGEAKPRQDALKCDACAADAADMRGEQ